MKKAIIVVGIVFVLLIAVLSIAPLFIDVNAQLKPILTEALEKNLNAKVTMGDLGLSLYRKVNLQIDSIKIVKEKSSVEISDINLIMPYSVLKRNPAEWGQRIKAKILAKEISVNSRKLVISKFKSDFVKDSEEIKLKDTSFLVFEGRGQSFLEIDLANNFKTLMEFEVKNGKWPVEKLKEEMLQKVPNIPRAKELISEIDLDDKFESLKGKITIQNGATNIESVEMNAPSSKTNLKAAGIINAKNILKVSGSLITPLGNVPKDLRNSDVRLIALE
jgi:hypothetical protein